MAKLIDKYFAGIKKVYISGPMGTPRVKAIVHLSYLLKTTAYSIMGSLADADTLYLPEGYDMHKYCKDDYVYAKDHGLNVIFYRPSLARRIE